MGEGAQDTVDAARAGAARPEDRPADVLAGVAPWLRPIAFVGVLAAWFPLPLLIAAVSSPAIAVLATLVAGTAAFVGAFFAARGQLIPTHVEVGTDGVSVAWMGLRWFHPFEGMEVAVPVGGGPEEEANNRLPNEAVRLTYPDGRTVKLGVSEKDHARLANSINRRLDEYQAADRLAPRGAAVEAIQRSEQTPDEWLAALKKQPVDGYRTDLTRQQLLEILQDPASPATARAAAAKLLRARVADRPLIRVVAEQTAQPKMRIALEAAASDEEEAEVDAALAELAD